MNGIASSTASTDRMEYLRSLWTKETAPAQAGGFAQAMAGEMKQTNQAEDRPAAAPVRAGGLNLNVTYNAAGRLDSQAADSESLVAAVTRAADEGREVSEETKAKLFSDDPNEFLEGLGEIVGKSPAQIMAALLTMNGTQVKSLAAQLEKLTGGAPTAMLSRFTGHPEAMLRQVLNNSGEEEEENGQKTEAAAFRQQLQEQSLMENLKSVDVVV